jgi:hypothetical protein
MSRIGVAEMGCSMPSIAESNSQKTLSYIYLFAVSSPSTLISFALLAFRSLVLFLLAFSTILVLIGLLSYFWMLRALKSVANYMEIYSLPV